MMISPQYFFASQLQGKSTDEIKTIIRCLKRKINHLKSVLEHPDYTHTIDPSEDVQLSCNRDYLKESIAALEARGESYKPTVAEQKDMDFNNNIPCISRIEFHIGGFFGPNTDVCITIDDTVHASIDKMSDPVTMEKENNVECPKEELFESLSDLHLGEWRRHYDLKKYGYFVCDGTQWELIIKYNNGRKPFKSSGDNAYPYNFTRFLEIIGAEDGFYSIFDEDEE
jgi:hypothetical protein